MSEATGLEVQPIQVYLEDGVVIKRYPYQGGSERTIALDVVPKSLEDSGNPKVPTRGTTWS